MPDTVVGREAIRVQQRVVCAVLVCAVLAAAPAFASAARPPAAELRTVSASMSCMPWRMFSELKYDRPMLMHWNCGAG